MTNFLEINLSCLKDPQLAESLRRTSPLENLIIIPSRSGSPVPCFHEKGHDHSYHSRFDPVNEGMKLYRSHKPGGIKIFLGLGGAYQITPFADSSRILIIEASMAHLKALLSCMDFSSLLSSDKVTLICEPREGVLSQWLRDNYIPLLDGRLDMIPLRPQIRFDQERFDNCAGEIEKALDQIASDSATQKKMGRLWQRNITANMDKALSMPMALPLGGGYREAVLTAAGPTLGRHREYLANLPGHVLLMTVDTALPVLGSWGIRPDYAVTLDPQFIGYLHFMNPLPRGCTLLADVGCSLPESLSPVKWFASPHPLVNYLIGDTSPLVMLRGGAGNVTQAALEILVRSGFKKITLLGADFAYPQAKPYERGSYFYPWYDVRSRKTSPLENHLTRFVLNQKNVIREGALYKTERLEQYRAELIDFIRLSHGRAANSSEGVWDLTFTGRNENTALFDPGKAGIWESYRKKLLSLSDLDNQPEWATLLPLAYSFYEDKSPHSPEKAIKKALEYTLTLLNRHI